MNKGAAKIRKFYGNGSRRSLNTQWEEKKIALERCASEFSLNPIPLSRRLRIDDPLPVFMSFPRQQIAFDYVKTCQQDVHVFAKEKDYDGKRSYIVATLPEFWRTYRRQPPEERRYYEVIPEGAACRLYFDLEFKKECNPDRDGPQMVDIFIKFVCHYLKDMYNIHCDRKLIIDLDSSTSSKFSRHLVFHLPGAVFKDNINSGNFVRHICTLLERKLGIGSEAESTRQSAGYCHGHSQQTDSESMCDSSIGDNGRPSNKKENCFGKGSKVDGNNTEQESGIKEEGMATVALEPEEESRKGSNSVDMFASVPLHELQKLFVKNSKGGCTIFCDQGVYTKNRNFRIYKSTKIGRNAHLVPSDQNAYKLRFNKRKGSFSTDAEFLLFIDSLVSNVSMQTGGKDVKILTCESCMKKAPRHSSQTGPQGSSSPSLTLLGNELSPYPEIDKFISRIINTGGVQGEIRRWVYFPQGKLLTYDILKNRWCENIGRPHKSNNIMMVVNLRQGVYYQKCHDPECRKVDYRSPERPIPEVINPHKVKDVEFSLEHELNDDDQELCKLAAECEELAKNSDCALPATQAVPCVTEGQDGKGDDVDWEEEDLIESTLLELEVSHVVPCSFPDAPRRTLSNVAGRGNQDTGNDFSRNVGEAHCCDRQSTMLSSGHDTSEMSMEGATEVLTEMTTKARRTEGNNKFDDPLINSHDGDDSQKLSHKPKNIFSDAFCKSESSHAAVKRGDTSSENEYLRTKRPAMRSEPPRGDEESNEESILPHQVMTCEEEKRSSAYASDDEISGWPEDDPVSDLELSIIADDIEGVYKVICT